MQDCIETLNASLDGDNRDMDERRKCDEIISIRDIWDVYILALNLLLMRLNNVDNTIVFK